MIETTSLWVGGVWDTGQALEESRVRFHQRTNWRRLRVDFSLADVNSDPTAQGIQRDTLDGVRDDDPVCVLIAAGGLILPS